MGHRWGAVVAFGLLVFESRVAVFQSAMAAPEDQAAGDQTEEIFGLTKVHQIHLKISAKDYAAMEPATGGFPFGPGGRPGGPGPRGPGPGAPGRAAPGGAGGRGGPGGPPGFGPDAGAGKFGFDFEYVHGDFQAGEQIFKDVGIRYKGNGTYMMSQRGAKRSFKIDFDRYGEKQNFHGARKL